MDDDQLLRYSRHILLDAIGIEGQERINAATALVIGAGGLGQLAINNGYMRSQYDVMYIAVGGILVMVLVFQTLGDMLSRWVDHR